MENNNLKTKKELEELYSLRPGLKKHEADLLRLADSLESSKPKSFLEQSFVERLREEVLRLFSSANERVAMDKKRSYSYFFWPAGSLALVFLAAVFSWELSAHYHEKPATKHLSDVNVSDQSVDEEMPVAKMAINFQKKEAPVSFAAISSETSGRGLESSVIEINKPKFYRGQNISWSAEQYPIYRRSDILPKLPSIISNQFKEFSEGTLLSWRFKDASGAYLFDYDFENGQISVSQNAAEMTSDHKKSISEKQALAAAAKILNDLNINKADYYQGVMDSNSQDFYQFSYPWQVDSRPVYEEYGSQSSLSLAINAANGELSWLNNWRLGVYEPSGCFASRGSLESLLQNNGISFIEEGKDLPDANYQEISDPIFVWRRRVFFKDGKRSEMLIPAISFVETGIDQNSRLIIDLPVNEAVCESLKN